MKLKENPIVYLSLKLWQYSEGDRKKVALYLGMSWLANLGHLCIPMIFALLLNELQKNGVTENNIYYLLFLSSMFIVRTCFTWSLHGPSRILENDNAFMNRARYKMNFLSGVLALPLSWHNEHHSGNTNDKLEKGSGGLFSFAENSFRVVIIINSMVVSLCILLFFDRGSALIAFIMILLTISIIVKLDKKLALQYKILNRYENKISEKILDVITNVTTVVILRIEKLLLKSISQKIMEPRDLFWKNNKLNEIKWFLVSLCTNVMLFLVVANYLRQIYFGLPLALGTLFALYGYTSNVAEMFFELADFYGNLLKHKARVLNAEELALEFKPVKNERNGNQKHDWRELKVESLNFSYHAEDGADLHLGDASFQIQKGEKVAFIGSTGSGKTTLLKVIRELYQPQNVLVYLDGKLLKNGFSSISSEITLIPQDPEIFAMSILENITIGVDYDMEIIKRYTDMACFTEVVERLPRKFDSLINEKGVNLSGGEKQRLALARGLLFACEDKLEDKSIILLDEPTSSIDIANELLIYQNIFRAFSDRAIISSVHRLHLLPMFDRIYFFENGRIIASGTFVELLKNSKEFQEVWSKYNSALSKAAQ